MAAVGSAAQDDAVDFKIPHCVNTIDETLALIPENRTACLAAQQGK